MNTTTTTSYENFLKNREAYQLKIEKAHMYLTKLSLKQYSLLWEEAKKTFAPCSDRVDRDLMVKLVIKKQVV